MDLMLDRDGTLFCDYVYLSDAKRVHIIDGVSSYLRYFKSLNCRLHIISNQSGVARNRISVNEHKAVHESFVEAFGEENIEFDSVSYCLHSPSEKCTCRKPQIGMIQNLMTKFDIDSSKSCLVGDKLSDIQTAQKFGCRFVKLSSNYFDVGQWEEIKKIVDEFVKA